MHNKTVKILFALAVGLIALKAGAGALVLYWPEATTALPLSGGSAGATELIRLTNEYRKESGLNPLTVNPRLTQAAVNKAKDILAKQYFNHTSPDGRKFSDWIKDVNYEYFYVGENLAIDFTKPQDVFTAWLNSPKHKENIIRPEFQEIGIADIGGQFEDHSTQIVVQLFGSRVLGVSETSTPSSTRATTTKTTASAGVKNSGGSMKATEAIDYKEWLKNSDSWLTWAVLLSVFLLLFALTRQKKSKKESPIILPHIIKKQDNSVATSRNTTSEEERPRSLYTKRTLTMNDRPNTSKDTLQPGSRKSKPIKSR